MNAQKKIGAFFDLDGTLLAAPSLEWRFMGYLLERDEITTANVARWVWRSAKACLRSERLTILANKHYLAGIPEFQIGEWEKTIAVGSLPLLAAGVDRVHWHLERQHRVVLVTGTLAPLARAIARHLPCGVKARATELEIRGGRLTGRISRKHLSFEEKARVIREEAAECNVDLSQSFAYGNEMSDVSMLETVGHPAVVNASWGLGREARKRGWTVYKWNDSRETGRRPRHAALAPKEAR
jgi:HAD superfamily hydrolase (TIGR01490 family)